MSARQQGSLLLCFQGNAGNLYRLIALLKIRQRNGSIQLRNSISIISRRVNVFEGGVALFAAIFCATHLVPLCAAWCVSEGGVRLPCVERAMIYHALQKYFRCYRSRAAHC
jgi:hypothetical protein